MDFDNDGRRDVFVDYISIPKLKEKDLTTYGQRNQLFES